VQENSLKVGDDVWVPSTRKKNKKRKRKEKRRAHWAAARAGRHLILTARVGVLCTLLLTATDWAEIGLVGPRLFLFFPYLTVFKICFSFRPPK
jgi:hypothetical protein